MNYQKKFIFLILCTEEITISPESFNQKIGFEFGKNQRDFDAIAQKISRTSKTQVKEITVSDAKDILMTSGKFSEVLGTIGAGKEATVLVARWKQTETLVCAKVFRYFTSTVKKRMQGTRHLFHSDIANIAATQEYWNLVTMYETRIPVPKPIELIQNILVMEMMDHPTDKTQPAPLLRDCNLEEPEHILFIMNNSIEILRKMFVKAHFVHGDYNIHNLMLCSKGLVTMDVSQSVEYNIKTNVNTPRRIKIGRAKEILQQDLYNLNLGFKKSYRVEFDVEQVLEDILLKLPDHLQDYLQDYSSLQPYSRYEAGLYFQKERYRADNVQSRRRRSYQRKKR